MSELPFSWFRPRRKRGVVRSSVAEVDWERVEELRPDRLGPNESDIQPVDETREDPWRPRRNLSNMPQY